MAGKHHHHGGDIVGFLMMLLIVGSIAFLAVTGIGKELFAKAKEQFFLVMQKESTINAESTESSTEDLTGETALQSTGKDTAGDLQSDAVAATPDPEAALDAVSAGSEGYYYSLLTQEEQIVYNEMYEIVMGLAEYTEISTVDEEAVSRIFDAVQNDHPEIFWLSGHRIVKAMQDEEILYITFQGEYTYSKEEQEALQAQLDAAVDAALESIPVGGDYETVKAVYEYVIRETTYGETSKDNQNVLSVFLEKESVCTGYAKSMQLLLQKLGIPCIYVTGISKGERHAWNEAYIDGAWYAIDPTWGDIGTGTDLTIESAEDEQALSIRYDYLNVTSEQIGRDHEADAEFTLPECSAVQDNYFVKEGRLLTDLDQEKLAELFDTQGVNVHFMCSDAQVYEACYEYLIDQNHVFAYYSGKSADENGQKHARFTCNQTLFTFLFW